MISRSRHVFFPGVRVLANLAAMILCTVVPYGLCAEMVVVTDSPTYTVQPGETFLVEVHFDSDDSTQVFDPHVNGIFSFGVSMLYDESFAVVDGTGSIAVDPALDFFGFSSPALRESVPGAARSKGNIDLSSSISYTGTHWATIAITNLAPAGSTYDLDLAEWRTAGANEQIVVDGLGFVLDPDLIFASALVQVVPEPGGYLLLLLTSAAIWIRMRPSSRTSLRQRCN